MKAQETREPDNFGISLNSTVRRRIIIIITIIFFIEMYAISIL